MQRLSSGSSMSSGNDTINLTAAVAGTYSGAVFMNAGGGFPESGRK